MFIVIYTYIYKYIILCRFTSFLFLMHFKFILCIVSMENEVKSLFSYLDICTHMGKICKVASTFFSIFIPFILIGSLVFQSIFIYMSILFTYTFSNELCIIFSIVIIWGQKGEAAHFVFPHIILRFLLRLWNQIYRKIIGKEGIDRQHHWI